VLSLTRLGTSQVDLSKKGVTHFKGFDVEVIDSMQDYVALLKTIFDFGKLKSFVTRPDVKLLLDSMHGGMLVSPLLVRLFCILIQALLYFGQLLAPM
jgi:phosphoglucomutase